MGQYKPRRLNDYKLDHPSQGIEWIYRDKFLESLGYNAPRPYILDPPSAQIKDIPKNWLAI